MDPINRQKLIVGIFNQVIITIAANLTMISCGMHIVWLAPALQIILSIYNPLQASNIPWLQYVFTIGGLFGLALTVCTVDKFGRKSTILIIAIQNMVAWIMIVFAFSIEVLHVSRFISGMATQIAFVAIPMYIAEIADHKIRGFLTSSTFIMVLIGTTIGYSVIPVVSLFASSSLGISFAILQLITLPFLPESPYFLIMKGNEDIARRSLQTLRSSQDVEAEYQDISGAVKRQLSEKGGFLDLYLIKSNRKAVIIMAVLSFSQHFCGLSFILTNIYYGIITVSGSSFELTLDPLFLSILTLVSCTVASGFIEKFGRRRLLIGSSLLSGFSLIALSIFFWLQNRNINVSTFNWVPFVAVIMCVVVYRVGLEMVPIVYTAELFPSSVKATGMAISNLLYTLSFFASIYAYAGLYDLFASHILCFICSGCCIFTAIFTAVYIPETKGKTLEEIQMILKGH